MVTFFVHGTYLPVVTPLLHLTSKQGVSQSEAYSEKDMLPKIGYILAQYAPQAFPTDSFYLFGWSGKLSFQERKQAAEDLYRALKNYSNPITLICHSHGCNVALNLASVALEHEDEGFTIDTLILLAGPVQEATKKYIKSPIFKEIISFYSEGDMFQVIDPQGLQHEKTDHEDFEIPLFSERIWPEDAHLTQVKVLFDHADPWHLDFILEKFIKFLPESLDILSQLRKITHESHFILDIDQKLETVSIRPYGNERE